MHSISYRKPWEKSEENSFVHFDYQNCKFSLVALYYLFCVLLSYRSTAFSALFLT